MNIELTEKQKQQQKDFIYKYIDSSNAATGSIFDANANVETKNVATLAGELNKYINIQIGRSLLSDFITKEFDKNTALEYNNQLNNHLLYCHDESQPTKPYCCSISMYPFLTDGLTKLGGESQAPKHLNSFCGSFVNLVFAISSQFAGACATVEFLMYFDYFARKDYGDDYLETKKKLIDNHLQHCVYAINQPAAARDYQSIFWNISIFDHEYFNSMFGDFVFPDMTNPKWETLNKLQKHFMKWFNKERKKAILTFPVVTAAILTEDKKPKDKEFAKFLSKELSKSNSFFIYMSDKADSLASCCFSGEQKCLTKSSNSINYITFKELSSLKKDFEIFHNGSWVNGKEIQLPNRKMYKIITSNNKEIIVSDNHINVTLNGEKETKDLKIDDKLLFNTNILDGNIENNKNLSYKDGFIIGSFLKNGLLGKKINGNFYDINFLMNKNNYKKLQNYIDKISNIPSIIEKMVNDVYSIKVSNKELINKIIKWTNLTNKDYSYNKELNLNCLLESIDFRMGIVNGLFSLNKNKNKCYTTSKKLVEQIEVLLTSLGINSNISSKDSYNEENYIKGQFIKQNHILYCIEKYNINRKRKIDNLYIRKNNSIYFNIKSIEKVDYDNDIYCFEMENKKEPYFTLPNGIITHNCRLRNEVTDNTFSYSLGAGGVMTGSINVMTLNVNRLVQQAVKKVKLPLSTSIKD